MLQNTTKTSQNGRKLLVSIYRRRNHNLLYLLKDIKHISSLKNGTTTN